MREQLYRRDLNPGDTYRIAALRRRVAADGGEEVWNPHSGWSRGCAVALADDVVVLDVVRAGPCCERDHDGDGNCDRHPERGPK